MKRDSPLIALYISLTSNMLCLAVREIKNRKYERRMIIQDRAANNRHGHFFVMTVLLALTLISTGCGNENKSASNKESEGPENQLAVIDQCGIVIDDTGWQVFSEIIKRHEAGQTVGREDFQVFADLPIVSQWKESMTGNLPSVRIVNWLEQTFNPTQEKATKRNLVRREFSTSFAYTIEHQKDIDPLIKKFRIDGIACNLMKKINFWVSPDVAPDSLIIAFLPSKPEIRIIHQYLFVDTGILQAGNMEQLENQLTGIIFQAKMQLHGEYPTVEEGQSAVANSIRVMMNDGIMGYIEDKPSTLFSGEHPVLGQIDIVPEQVYGYGIKAVELFNLHLPGMLADENLMQKKGNSLVKTLGASNSLNQGGFTMSATIAANLGDEALRDTAGSPSAWLAAYQKAARMNPVPTPEPHTVMGQFHLSMPPFDDEVYEGLQKILRQAFETQ